MNLFNPDPFAQIKGQVSMSQLLSAPTSPAAWCEHAGCPREQCVECQKPAARDAVKR